MKLKPTIAIGSDHAGFQTKTKLVEYLQQQGYELKDFGTYSPESVDYPIYAHQVAAAVEHKEKDLGIVVCGSGNGVNITANKHQGIRSALCWLPEIAQLARLHNDANVCAVPARFIPVDLAIQIVQTFLDTHFEGGRHQARVDKISC